MDGFGRENLPYGVARLPGGGATCVSALDGDVIDLAALASAGAFDVIAGLVPGVLAQPSLNRFLACGRAVWSGVRTRLGEMIDAGDRLVATTRTPVTDVELALPVEVGDFVDFSASLHHAVNMARIFRPGTGPLRENWRDFPRGYHGRTGSIVASGTGVTRPHGRVRTGVRPTAALDIEAEVGFVVGAGNVLGEPIPEAAAADHVAGLVLVNDWSARDIQLVESEPLGPFLAKSFATSVSPWLVTLDALAPYRVPGGGGYDIQIELQLNGVTISCPRFSTMYWSIPQLLAHATLNGAATRPGDLFGCGTTSGPDPWTEGSLIELTWDGEHPLRLPDGTSRAYLQDGDTVTLRGWAGGDGRPLVSLGDVTGTVLPARTLEV
ncbi:MAG: fumarylacetoacetate hydrolase family protein [Acidimicrobiales bacterium]